MRRYHPRFQLSVPGNIFDASSHSFSVSTFPYRRRLFAGNYSLSTFPTSVPDAINTYRAALGRVPGRH